MNQSIFVSNVLFTDNASSEKLRLEENQRARRKERNTSGAAWEARFVVSSSVVCSLYILFALL